MDVMVDLTGDVYNNMEVLEYYGYDVYICKCLKCESVTNVAVSDLKSKSKKNCDECNNYKFDLETSEEIYELHITDNVPTTILAKQYRCARQTISKAIHRIEKLKL